MCLNKDQFWELKSAIANLDFSDSAISDSVSDSYRNDVQELLEWESIANVVNKIETRSNLYDRVIEFYKFIEIKNLELTPSLLEVLKIWELYPKCFHLKLFPHFVRIFESSLSFDEILKRLDIINNIDIKTHFFNNKYNILTFERKVKMTVLSENFYDRLSALKKIEEIRWWLLADDIWFIFRWRGVHLDNLASFKDMFEEYGYIDWRLRQLYANHSSISENILAKKEALKSWSNILHSDVITALCNDKNISIEHLNSVLDIMRDVECEFPQEQYQNRNFLWFIRNYFDPKSRMICYDDENNECVHKGMYTLKELIEQGMHLYDDDIPF